MDENQAISQNQLKFLRRLKTKKYRYKHRAFIAEGNKLVMDLISAGLNCKALYIDSLSDASLFPDAVHISDKTRKSFSVFDNPSGAVGVFEMPNQAPPSSNLILALYGVQDPGNLGTILRTAVWFGVFDICLLDGTTDPFNAKCVQASMGAIAHTRLTFASAGDILPFQSQGYQLLGADMEGESIYGFDWPEKAILIMGNEGQGLKGFPLEYRALSIPSRGGKAAESLNVAMASGIILSHFAGSV
ncbi:MAG: RNA methyltransferase [Cryomorphaceae bacterium]|nr:RNA methyltransferase [Cryomorphaceae bacterium]